MELSGIQRGPALLSRTQLYVALRLVAFAQADPPLSLALENINWSIFAFLLLSTLAIRPHLALYVPFTMNIILLNYFFSIEPDSKPTLPKFQKKEEITKPLQPPPKPHGTSFAYFEFLIDVSNLLCGFSDAVTSPQNLS